MSVVFIVRVLLQTDVMVQRLQRSESVVRRRRLRVGRTGRTVCYARRLERLLWCCGCRLLNSPVWVPEILKFRIKQQISNDKLLH